MARKNATQCYIAFLRGINVGGHRVKMERLRELFEAMKYANVSTFIASGNVIFETIVGDSSAMEAQIEEHLKRELGYEVRTFLRTPAELAAIAEFRPFESGDVEGHTLHVGFMREPLGEEEARAILAFRGEMDDFRVHGRELYWLCRGKVTDSLVSWPVVMKAVPAASTTMRNVTTVRKLAAMHETGDR